MPGRVIFLLARIIPSLLALVVAAVLTRLLNPEEYGLYALGLSIVFFLNIGVFEWLGLSLMRMAARVEHPQLFFGTLMACFVALLGVCVTVAGLALAAGLGTYASLVVASLCASGVSVWFELRQRLQMAELRTVEYFRMSVGRGLITTLLVCTAAFAWRSAYLSLFALSASIFLAGLLVPERHLRFKRLSFDPTIFAALFRFGFPLSLSVGLGTILMSVDRWLLQALSGPEAVGLFTASALVGQMPILALANGVGPLAYSLAVRTLEFRSAEATKSRLAQNFIILLSVVLPSAMGIVALADNLAHLMVGEYYRESVVLLAPWLSATAVLTTMRSFYVDTAFQLANRTSLLLWFMLFAVAVNVGLDIWLIPTLGVLGAAVGSFGALLSSSVAATIFSRSVFPLPLPVIEAAKVLTSACVMFLVIREFASWSGPWALACQILTGCGIYTLLLIVFNVLNVRGWLIRRGEGHVSPAPAGPRRTES